MRSQHTHHTKASILMLCHWHNMMHDCSNPQHYNTTGQDRSLRDLSVRLKRQTQPLRKLGISAYDTCWA